MVLKILPLYSTVIYIIKPKQQVLIFSQFITKKLNCKVIFDTHGVVGMTKEKSAQRCINQQMSRRFLFP